MTYPYQRRLNRGTPTLRRPFFYGKNCAAAFLYGDPPRGRRAFVKKCLAIFAVKDLHERASAAFGFSTTFPQDDR
jgi:hypothetical protein